MGVHVRVLEKVLVPELAVGTEAVLDLVSEAGSVHRGRPLYLRDVHPRVLADHDPVTPVLPVSVLRLQTRQPQPVIESHDGFLLDVSLQEQTLAKANSEKCKDVDAYLVTIYLSSL